MAWRACAAAIAAASHGMSELPAAPDKKAIRRYWAARGESWDRWADVVAESAVRMNEPLIAAARLAPGLRVLDLASGAGQPALAIAERLGPGGEVVATDLVPEMLAGARRRAAVAGLANVRFGLADMEALPFRARCFDRVTCRFGIMFAPAVAKALAEALRVLVPGGRAAFMAWGPREDTTMFRIIIAAAERELEPDPTQDMSMIFRFGQPGSLGAAFEGAGFLQVAEEEVRLAGSAPVGRPFWRPQLEMSLGPRFIRADAARRRALEAAVTDAFSREIRDDRYILAAHVRICTGHRAAGD